MSRLTVVAILGSALLHGGAFLVTAQDANLPSAKTPGERPVRYEAQDDLPKDKAAEKWRDYAVLEAALEDIIWPENPEFRYGRGRKDEILEVVLGDKTLAANDLTELDLQLDRPSQNIAGKDPRSVPVDTQADFKRRSKAPPISLADFRPTNRRIRVEDVKALYRRTDGHKSGILTDSATATEFVVAYPPAFSSNGISAIVVFVGLARRYHGSRWLCMLSRKGNRWKVDWRHLNYSQ
jgi:hypothetical protein